MSLVFPFPSQGLELAIVSSRLASTTWHFLASPTYLDEPRSALKSIDDRGALRVHRAVRQKMSTTREAVAGKEIQPLTRHLLPQKTAIIRVPCSRVGCPASVRLLHVTSVLLCAEGGHAISWEVGLHMYIYIFFFRRSTAPVSPIFF